MLCIFRFSSFSIEECHNILPYKRSLKCPFSSPGAYYLTTTPQPIICHFAKNVYVISPVLAVGYENVKNCTPDSMKI